VVAIKPQDLLEQVVLKQQDKVMTAVMARQRILVVKSPRAVEEVGLEPLGLMAWEVKEVEMVAMVVILFLFGQQ
jgi:hypothetical protein